jgi:hypothetical protein
MTLMLNPNLETHLQRLEGQLEAIIALLRVLLKEQTT